jgi:hypothetical protein
MRNHDMPLEHRKCFFDEVFAEIPVLHRGNTIRRSVSYTN